MVDVTVIGLGTMGSTIARLLLQNGHRVTVWNRTSAKADPLVRDGAILAPSTASAVYASSIVIVCVHDYKATNMIFDTAEVTAALADRVLIQLTTGSPQEGRDSEVWAQKHGAEYLDGAIQVAPSQMGRSDTPILISGAETAFQRSESLLKILAGNLIYLGEKVSLASAMDLATLSYIYGATLGFFHGARICEAESLGVDAYGAIVADIAPTFGEFLKHEGKVIQTGDYAISESPLRISVEATERLVQTAQAAQINTEFPTFASGLFKRAVAEGYGNEEAAALVKVLR
jgi:3-hydroxyisobutyrate dehydrogenase-like beta-hydroxyacid dehydrogenase